MPELRWFMNNGDFYYFGEKPPHISGVELDQTSINLDTPGQTVQLTATVLPQDTIDSYTLTWSSSDASVATVSQTGLVTCVTPGDATITVTTTPGNFTATCSVMADIILEADLTNTTLSALQAQGWTDVTSTSNRGYVLNSNGFQAGGTRNDTWAYLYKTMTATEKQKIKSIDLYVEGVGVYGNWTGGAAAGIWGTLVSDTGLFAQSMFTSNSGYRGQQITYNGSGKNTQQVALSSNPYSIHFTYDYNTGVSTFVLKVAGTEKYNTTYTLSSSEKSTVAGYNYISFRAGWGIKSGNGNTVTYVKLTLKM